MLAGLIAAVCLLTAAVAKGTDWHWQSGIFVTLTLAQLGVAIALRPAGSHRRNVFLPAAVAGNVLLVILAVTWPPLMHILDTQALAPGQWLLCHAGALVVAGAARLQRASGHHSPHRRPIPRPRRR